MANRITFPIIFPMDFDKKEEFLSLLQRDLVMAVDKRAETLSVLERDTVLTLPDRS